MTYGINKPRELINEKAKLKLGGTIIFEDFERINQPSFVEYLKTGWFINLSVAIDFTASNGDLHKLYLDGMNDYETALLEVGNILEPYAYKKKFAGFGFGGIPQYGKLYEDNDSINHCFNLNRERDPTITGVTNLLGTYREAIKGTTPWGPTYYEPILKMVLKYMRTNIRQPVYHILLILTDGCIHDMRVTIDMIVQCSHFPLSIIIVGIGDADFTAMETLDSDEIDLVDGKQKPMERDIVQFVRLNEFRDGKDMNVDKLAEAVLGEVPEQLVDYMTYMKLQPGDKIKPNEV